MELVVGRIVKSHGIRGEVVVDIRTDSPEERFAKGSALATRTRKSKGSSVPETLNVEAARNHSGRLLVRFAGVGSRDDADALRDVELLVDSDSFEPLDDDDEFYDHQLEGLDVRVENTGAASIGQVSEVLHTPAGEVLSITTLADGPHAGREVLVPFIEQFVPTVDLAAGTVVITPPDGLLDITGGTDGAAADDRQE